MNLPVDQKYEFSFDWAARHNQDFGTSHIDIYFNNELIFEGRPQDYEIHHEKFDINGRKGDNWLEIKAGGKSDGLGATMDNLRIFLASYYP